MGAFASQSCCGLKEVALLPPRREGSSSSSRSCGRHLSSSDPLQAVPQGAHEKEHVASNERQLEERVKELELQLSEWRGRVEHANAPIMIVDCNGYIVECNPVATDLFCCPSQDSLVGRSVPSLFDADCRFKLETVLAAGVSCHSFGDCADCGALGARCAVGCSSGEAAANINGSREHFQLRLRISGTGTGSAPPSPGGDASGVYAASGLGSPAGIHCTGDREFILRASANRGHDKVVKSFFFVFQDISQLLAQRLQAERRAEDLARLFGTLNAPIVGVDGAGRMKEWNRKAELLTGYTREEILGRSLAEDIFTHDYGASMHQVLQQALVGQENATYEFPLFTKAGQRRDILLSTSTQRDASGEPDGVIGVGQDISELRRASNMLANYVKICGAAVWFMWGSTASGAMVTLKTKEIEHLISQQAEMDTTDPRMVLWRASFVSILKMMCQNLWRWHIQRQAGLGSSSQTLGQESAAAVTTNPPWRSFHYEFCFEATNGQVKWYKVEGHLIEETASDREFEVTGSMQEVTSMWIDKVMGDRWQKWWSRMCHMVFDATLLVDTQEYRVLNAWGEEKVFGCKLQCNHAVLMLIKGADHAGLKQAFNEVTFKGSERGREMIFVRPDGKGDDVPAQCFLLAADQENPNECMMGIRMQVSSDEGDGALLWDVSKPNPVMTLEDLARLKSGLRRHRRPSRAPNPTGRAMRNGERVSARVTRSAHASSQSLSSIPEDMHGEDEYHDQVSETGSSMVPDLLTVVDDTESLNSSSNSSNNSVRSSKTSGKTSTNSVSEVGMCNSDPEFPNSEDLSQFSKGMPGSLPPNAYSHRKGSRRSDPLQSLAESAKKNAPTAVVGPPCVRLRWAGKVFELNLDDFGSVGALRDKIQDLTGIRPGRQTLILAGRRLPPGGDNVGEPNEPEWDEVKATVRPGQMLMLIGSAKQDGDSLEPRVPSPTPLPEPTSVESAPKATAPKNMSEEPLGATRPLDGYLALKQTPSVPGAGDIIDSSVMGGSSLAGGADGADGSGSREDETEDNEEGGDGSGAGGSGGAARDS